MHQNAFFPQTRNLLVSQKTTQTFFHPPSPFPDNFLLLQQCWHLYCFAILGSTSIVIHCVKQRLLRKQPGSDAVKDYKGHSVVQTSFYEPPNKNACIYTCMHTYRPMGKKVNHKAKRENCWHISCVGVSAAVHLHVVIWKSPAKICTYPTQPCQSVWLDPAHWC